MLVPSSDFDHEQNPFPTIEEFFDRKHNLDPKQQGRNLPALVSRFTDEDVFCINELEAYSADQLASGFNLSRGNANYIRDEVSKEIKRVKKTLRASRAWQ